MKKTILFFAAFILVLFHVQAQSGCDPDGKGYCGVSITQEGYGAVELCEDCFVCGEDDGVCPEDFTSGELLEEVYMLLKPPVGDRPSGFTNHSYNFEDGNTACQEIGGNCVYIEESADDDLWSSSGLDCNSNVDDEDKDLYYRAVCNDVPRTPSCGYCIDPDCKTTLKGYAYDNATDEPLEGAPVLISTEINPEVYSSGESDSDGSYEFDSVRGNLNFSCGYDRYYPIQDQPVELQRGSNVVDCALEEAECGPDCTLPNEYGVDICRSDCDGRNGCEYQNTTFQEEDYHAVDVCDGVEQGSFEVIGRENSTHVKGVTCCTGEFEYKFSPEFNLNADDVSSLLTREYRRVLDDEPVTVKIIVYEE